ncbi:hypothetical protein ASPBRDRAFT_281622 [Aspergillus brasiliensis CBS 101740]|uniref:Oxidase ustYa n=1 Tax=Aspergillus brasiliensis (strain CBS 101740 / IMI 381727 / IBT 21946) TaxID=767769 RepID=A0A1L9UD19_ASPBC|nr:hypothetical protein ASPBRDRAFT_281622 [Aspergillus brasiliensis CBS 101740]
MRTHEYVAVTDEEPPALDTLPTPFVVGCLNVAWSKWRSWQSTKPWCSSHLLWSTVALLVFVLGFGAGAARARSLGGKMVIENDILALPEESYFGHVPTSQMIFDDHAEFHDTTVRGDDSWDKLMPLGEGYLRIPHPRRFDIPPSSPILNDPDAAELYMVSSVHQLHCLRILRDVIVKVDNDNGNMSVKVDKHVFHCLDYLRQAIMCAGDTTLEWARVRRNANGDLAGYFFDGRGSSHQCRDWTTIVGILEANRNKDPEGVTMG